MVAALPVDIGTQRRWSQVNRDIQILHALDSLVPVENLVRELGMECLFVICEQIDFVVDYFEF